MIILSTKSFATFYIYNIDVNPDKSVNLHLAKPDTTDITVNIKISSSETDLIAEKIRLSKY